MLLSGCESDDSTGAPLAVAKVTVSATRTTLEVGESLTLAASARDGRDSVVSGASIVWSASPPDIASVNNGVVTALFPGTVTIVARSGVVSGNFAIDVVPAAAAFLTATAPTATMAAGQTQQLSSVVRDARGTVITGRAVSWRSTNTTALLVDANGLLSAIGAGNAFIVAHVDGLRDSLQVSVADGSIALSVSPHDVELVVGATRTITARLRDGRGSLSVVSGTGWISTSPLIASVTDGVVSGLAVGSTWIVAQAGALRDSVRVRVGAGGNVFLFPSAAGVPAEIHADSVHIAGDLVASGPLTIVSSGDIVIRGSILAPCFPIALVAGGRVIVDRPGPIASAGIENSCPPTSTPMATPGIRIEAAAGYTIVFGRIRSSGDIQITNSAGLVPSQFVGPPIDASREVCLLRNALVDHATIADGASGSIGERGRDGARIDVSCLGSMRVSLSTLIARGGSNGGNGTHTTYAVGGDGGRAGSVRLRVTGHLTVDVRRLNIRVFSSGTGGNATVTQPAGDTGDAVAIGGRGGDTGASDQPPIEFRVAGNVVDNDPLPQNSVEFGIFISGKGGTAVSTAANGMDALSVVSGGNTVSTPARVGRPATAIGGDGGAVFPSVVSVGGSLGTSDLWILGSPAGDGGTATAVGGNGGTGSSAFPNGAPGGAMRAEGGNGGSSTAINTPEGLPATGGNGGRTSFSGGNGGAGFHRCNASLVGGSGGFGGAGARGGSVSGFDGRGGGGVRAGAAGGVMINGAANGGAAGRGNPAGPAGAAGADATTALGLHFSVSSLSAGAIAGTCRVLPD